MRFYFLPLIFCCSPFFSPAQTMVWEDGNKDINAGRKVFILEDKHGALSIDDISQPAFEHQFRVSKKEVLDFGFTQSVFWLRFSVHNKTNDSLWLELAHAFIPYADLYFRDDTGKWQVLRAGYKIPLAEKTVKSHFQVFPLRKNTDTFYIRMVPYMHPITVKIWNARVYDVKMSRIKLFYGAYTGILLFAIIINVFLFLAFRRTYYLLYSLLVFLYILSAASVLEGFLIYLLPDTDLLHWYRIVPVLDMPALLLYCISFLELKKYTPILRKVLIGACIFISAHLVLLHFLPLMAGFLLNYIYAALVFCLAIAAGIKAGNNGNEIGKYFAWAYTVWLMLLVAELSFILTGWPGHIFDISYVSVAIFIETLLLALLMVRRFLWEKRNDEKAKMEIKEQTLENISQEIHDNIGQTLTLAKLNLATMDGNTPAADAEKLQVTKKLLTDAIQDLRNISKTMNTDYITKAGLAASIQQLLQMIERTGVIVTRFEQSGEGGKYSPHRQILLFRIVQELLNNIMKHAGATAITVNIVYRKTEMIISVSDNGKGFDTEKANTGAAKGLGLHNVMNRAGLIRGSLVIKSEEGKGTTVLIKVPAE